MREGAAPTNPAVRATPASPAPVEHELPWGLVVRGIRWGTGPDRLLLFHEPGADLDHWGSLPAMLASRLPLEIVAYDLPGHGLSDDPWEPDRLSDAIRALAGGEARERRRFVVAAGSVATVALDLAEHVRLAGAILLSPAPNRSLLRRSPLVPKLLFAASLVKADITNARKIAGASGGWAVVTSVPVAATGTGMLATAWTDRIADQIGVFVHDCVARAGDTEDTSRKRSTETR